jgi:hypothetical protein
MTTVSKVIVDEDVIKLGHEPKFLDKNAVVLEVNVS